MARRWRREIYRLVLRVRLLVAATRFTFARVVAFFGTFSALLSAAPLPFTLSPLGSATRSSFSSLFFHPSLYGHGAATAADPATTTKQKQQQKLESLTARVLPPTPLLCFTCFLNICPLHTLSGGNGRQTLPLVVVVVAGSLAHLAPSSAQFCGPSVVFFVSVGGGGGGSSAARGTRWTWRDRVGRQEHWRCFSVICLSLSPPPPSNPRVM